MDKKNISFSKYTFLLFTFLSALICLSDYAPIQLEILNTNWDVQKYFYVMYDGVISQELGGPYIFRLFVPYAVYYLHLLFQFVEPIYLALALEFVALIGIQYFFYRYLLTFVQNISALAGVFLLDVLLMYILSQFIGITHTEVADIINVLIYVLALYTIISKRFYLLIAVLFLGMFNRETPLLLLPALAYYQWQQKASVSQIVLIALALFLPYIGIRWYLQDTSTTYAMFREITYNIPFLNPEKTYFAIKANLLFALLLLPLAYIGSQNFKQQSLLFKCCLLTVPPFIVLHYIVGTISETRLWMPLLILLIPSIMWNLEKEKTLQ